MLKKDFWYDLPKELIAQEPADPRDSARLMVLSQKDDSIQHKIFHDLPEFLEPGDLLVVNNSKVLPARIVGVKQPTGAVCELLLLRQVKGDQWECLAKPGKRMQPGTKVSFGDGSLTAVVDETMEDGNKYVTFYYDTETLYEKLDEFGKMPLPPYITKQLEDQSQYQTVYAKELGSAAAPTAGLHFTPELIERLRREGIRTEEVTLHVGAGTFLPVKTDNPLQHTMHTEHFEVRLDTLQHLPDRCDDITAVGTTAVRTLESLPALGWRIHSGGSPDVDRVVGQWEPYDIPDSYTGRDALEDIIKYMRQHGMDRLKASTQIMITPLDFRFRIVRRIITNFHQPKSTLLLLISAYVGDDWRRIYRYALDNGFRFLSYGDSSLLICDERGAVNTPSKAKKQE